MARDARSGSRAGELRVRVRCCAVCRTDLHIIEGDLPPPPKLPLVPGHQIVGIVDALGEGATRFKSGDRVGIAWLRYTCGRCRYCTSGRENLCPFSRYTGYHADGGYAPFAVVSQDFAYPIPDAFEDDTFASPLLCAGIIGYRAPLRSNLRDGQTLAIFGFGSSAHIVLQIVRHRGCEVLVVTRGKNHQELARELGASWAGSDAEQMPRHADAAIVFAPAGEVVPAALRSIDPGGAVALAGIHMSPIPSIDYDRDLFGERDLHPVTANTRDDANSLLRESAAAMVQPRVKIFPLREANRALLELKSGKIDGTAVLVVE